MADEEDVDPRDFFTMAPDGEQEAMAIARRLIDADATFQHLKDGEATILFLMRTKERIKAERRILGTMALPRFSGELGAIGTWMLARLCDGLPDFIMTLDATWWQQATALQREALVFHELLHAVHASDKEGAPKFTEEGNPVWGIVGHDLEEFNAVVERYGAWLPDIAGFMAAARRGGA